MSGPTALPPGDASFGWYYIPEALVSAIPHVSCVAPPHMKIHSAIPDRAHLMASQDYRTLLQQTDETTTTANQPPFPPIRA